MTETRRSSGEPLPSNVGSGAPIDSGSAMRMALTVSQPADADRRREDECTPVGDRYRYRVPKVWYRVPMAFNVKDDEVIRLADELATRLHLPSRIDAIRHALKAQIEVTQSRARNRSDELLDVLSAEIWPLLTDRSPITKAEREQALGYDPATGV